MSRKARSPSAFVVNTFKITSANVIAQSIGVLVTPILTRLFPPQAFGVAALLTSFTVVIAILSALRYEVSIMLASTDGEAANILFLSLCSVLVTSFMTLLIVFLAGDLVSSALNYPELTKYLWMLPIAVLIRGVFSIFDYWNSRTKNFDRLSFARILTSITMRGGKLGAGFIGYVTGGILFAADLVGYLVSCLFVARQIWIDHRQLFIRTITWDRIIAVLKRYKKFPLYSTWSVLLNATSEQLPNLILAFFFPPQFVGFFAVGRQLVKLPVNLISLSIKQVFFQRAATANYEGKLDKVVEKVFTRLISFGMFPFFLITIFGKDLFSYVLGPNWAESGVYAQLISFWIFFLFISTPLKTLFSLLEAQQEEAVLSFVAFFLRFISLIAGGALGDAKLAIGFFALTAVATSSFICYRILSKVHVKIIKCLEKISLNLAVSAVLLSALVGFHQTLKPSPFVFATASCSCTVLYYAFALYVDENMRSQIGMLLMIRLRGTRTAFHGDI